MANGFCLQSFMNSKSPVNCFVWNHQYFEKIEKYNIFVMPPPPPPQFYHRFMYIHTSSGESLPHINWLFKWIVRRFEVDFWCLEWECCTFWQIYENSFKSTNTILRLWLHNCDLETSPHEYTLFKSDVTSPDHVVRCRGSQECWFTLCQFPSQFHSRWHSLRITLKSTTLLFMRSSNAWTTKPWQRS